VTRRWPVAGVALAGLWLFIRGVGRTGEFTLGDAGITVVEEGLIGLGVGMVLAFYTRRLYAERIDGGGVVRALPYALIYLVLFLKELLTANVEVAYRVLAPSLPIDPDVYEVSLRVESDIAVTVIANSISLTPGTLTMDYDPDHNALYVHSLAGPDRDSVVAPIRTWEDYALVIFDERRSPGDPVPDHPSTPTVDGGATPDAEKSDRSGGESA
jgi:Multisubunit Na+/H+ antiporter, MnhE subunit